MAVVGLLVGYLLHALDLEESCFIVAWLVVLIEAVGQACCSLSTFGLGARALGLATLGATEMMLVGAWISLKFEWLPEQHPDAAALCARLLYNLMPLPSAAIVTWGVGAVCGAEATPYALLGEPRRRLLPAFDAASRLTRHRRPPQYKRRRCLCREYQCRMRSRAAVVLLSGASRADPLERDVVDASRIAPCPRLRRRPTYCPPTAGSR